jgi:peptidoglycan/LPS O-acetylase OafA/YrhL
MKLINAILANTSSRVVGLDILRSIAILTVVLEHGGYLLPKRFHSIYGRINFIHIDGVSIFFVLSGFLIGGILIKTIHKTDFTKHDLLQFWIRRWFRTLPNYLLILLIVLAARLLIFHDFGEFNYTYFVFLQNAFSIHPAFFAEAWSLSVEEWFYMLFPFACFVIYKSGASKSSALIYSILLFLIFPLALRISKFEAGIGIDDFSRQYRKIAFLRLDSLMYGVIAAYLRFVFNRQWERFKMPLVVVGCFLLMFMALNPMSSRGFYLPLYFNVESLAVCSFLPFMASLRSTKFRFLDRSFVFVSIISYSMYLLNLTPIQHYLIPLVNRILGVSKNLGEYVSFLNYFLFWFFTFFLSTLLYYFYERPLTALRDRVKIGKYE